MDLSTYAVVYVAFSAFWMKSVFLTCKDRRDLKAEQDFQCTTSCSLLAVSRVPCSVGYSNGPNGCCVVVVVEIGQVFLKENSDSSLLA